MASCRDLEPNQVIQRVENEVCETGSQFKISTTEPFQYGVYASSADNGLTQN